MSDWENVEIKDIRNVIATAAKKEELHEIGSTYVVCIFETVRGKIYVTDNYAIEENLAVEQASWEEALSFGKSFIHDRLPPPPIIPLRDGINIAHWGITDLYDDAEAKLKELLAGGDDFDTGWSGSKKELDSMRITAIGDTITLEVSQWMDDVESGDLVIDAMTDAEMKVLSKDDLNKLIEICIDNEVQTEFILSRDFPRTVSFAELMQAVGECVRETAELLEEQFGYCKKIVREYLHPSEV